MPRAAVFVLLIGALAVNAAPAPFFRPQRGATSDLDQLQGSWILAAEGKRPAGGERFVIRIIRDELQAREGNTQKVERYSLKIDHQSTPKRIDLVELTDEGDQESRTVRGIYRLDGDTFKVYFNKNGKTRPAQFDEKFDLLVFRRLK
jgi:uncharacterized protein (TIGR03067 family)